MMNKLKLVLMGCGLAIGLGASAQEKNSMLNTEKDKASYAIGSNIGTNLKSQGLGGIDADLLLKGLKDVLEGKTPLLDQQSANQAVNDYIQKEKQKEFEAQIGEGKKFLEENGKRKGVTTTTSGLQYEVITMGNGAKPSATDKVLTHYHGTLIDGKVFDSSVQRGQPLSFGLNQVIVGWTEGIQLMPVGSKFKFYIPYHLAYGERGAPPSIAPYSTLIFEVDLLGIE